MIQEKIIRSNGCINIGELRQLAILTHQLHVLELEKSLWTTYYQAGTGILLKATENNRLKLWPLMLKKIMQFERRPTTVSDPDQIPIDENECSSFVRDHQRELESEQLKCQQQYDFLKQNCPDWINTIENNLQAFIQKHLQLLRLKYECRMKLVEFDYRQQVLEYSFNLQDPHHEQVTDDFSVQYFSIERLSFLSFFLF